MSLLDQFTKIKNHINNSNNIIDQIYEKDIEYYFEHPNQWRAKKYSKSGLSTTSVPAKSDITSINPSGLSYRNTSDRSYSWNWADDYVRIYGMLYIL